MEQKRENESDFSGEKSPVASASLEKLSSSVETPISSVANGNHGSSFDKLTVENSVETEANEEKSDVRLFIGNTEYESPVEIQKQETSLKETCVVVSPTAVSLGSAGSSETLQKEVAEISRLGNSPSVGVTDTSVHTDTLRPSVPSSGAISHVSADSFDQNTEVKSSLPLAQLNDQKNADLAKQRRLTSSESEKQEERVDTDKGFIDTVAQFESVKEAVSKFGGIVDWKAHKTQALERRKLVLSELEKVQKEIPEYKKHSEVEEYTKAELLKELVDSKKTIEELKVNLERVQTEEAQARQDSELAQLRFREIEQGIAGETSVAVKTQQEVAKARHEAAIAELKLVKEELKVLQEKYVCLINEREMTVRKAEEAVSASKEMEQTVDDLTLELIAVKELLELAQTSHMEAEEHRMGASLARDQDELAWQEELNQADQEVQRLTQQLSSVKDVNARLDTSSTLLANLKAELAAYMEAKLIQESDNVVETVDVEQTTEIQGSLQELASTRKELEQVKAVIEKTKEEVIFLKVAASSLKSELDKETGSLMTLRQQEGMASITVSSLETELVRANQELEVVRMKEKEVREKMVELPKLLQQAAEEANEAKSAAQAAQEELRHAKELAEQAKASASTTEIRLEAALKEIEAAKASEQLALTAIKALEESTEDSPSGVTLPIDEYFNLSKKAHDAEELAHERVASALAQMQEAKQSELECLQRLEEGYDDLSSRKEALRGAKAKAEKAKEGKVGAEQELRKWRAENEQRRKGGDAAKFAVSPLSSPQKTKSFDKKEDDVFVHPVQDTSSYTSEESSPWNYVSENNIRRRKRSFFPRIFLYLANKSRQQGSKSHT